MTAQPGRTEQAEQAEREVRQRAAELVAAFARDDPDTYFACFAPDASFVFHDAEHVVTSTEEYRRLRAGWEAEHGFRVLGCETSDTRVQVLGETAVLTHTVRTRTATHEGEQALHERETVVFHRQAPGLWLAVHEHLSPAPPGAS
ncbi:YybH family protein [Quadrisphaera sp. KR29]|uniref:YybH family protein n=1 Tax=Quadrisphaera sp. KR29 TaxID=3461391 RepID=UPI004043D8B7